MTTAVMRTSKTSECDRRERGELLKEDLERNMTLCLDNSFCETGKLTLILYLVANKE